MNSPEPWDSSAYPYFRARILAGSILSRRPIIAHSSYLPSSFVPLLRTLSNHQNRSQIRSKRKRDSSSLFPNRISVSQEPIKHKIKYTHTHTHTHTHKVEQPLTSPQPDCHNVEQHAATPYFRQIVSASHPCRSSRHVLHASAIKTRLHVCMQLVSLSNQRTNPSHLPFPHPSQPFQPTRIFPVASCLVCLPVCLSISELCVIIP